MRFIERRSPEICFPGCCGVKLRLWHCDTDTTSLSPSSPFPTARVLLARCDDLELHDGGFVSHVSSKRSAFWGSHKSDCTRVEPFRTFGTHPHKGKEKKMNTKRASLSARSWCRECQHQQDGCLRGRPSREVPDRQGAEVASDQTVKEFTEPGATLAVGVQLHVPCFLAYKKKKHK